MLKREERYEKFSAGCIFRPGTWNEPAPSYYTCKSYEPTTTSPAYLPSLKHLVLDFIIYGTRRLAYVNIIR